MRVAFGFKSRRVSEEILFRSVARIYGAVNVTRRYRGRELGGLELDVWVSGQRLGFEYQGEQHSKHVVAWMSELQFKQQKNRDRLKIQRCDRLGYTLILLGPRDDLSVAGVGTKIGLNGLLPP